MGLKPAVVLAATLGLAAAALLGLWLAEQTAFAFVGLWGCDLRVEIPFQSTMDASVVVVSDVHVLGEAKRNALDRWWTDRQLYASASAAVARFHPRAFLALGDNVDEGAHPRTDEQRWQRYTARFRGALVDHLPEETAKVLGVVGNHDAGLGRTMNAASVTRFEKAFGGVNEVVELKELGLELVLVNEMLLDRCLGGERADGAMCAEVLDFLDDLDPGTDGERLRLLLLHMPLFRPNDLDCGAARRGEGGHVTYEAPESPLRVGIDVLSKRSTERLLEAVQPDLVLSGHTHAQCVRSHVTAAGDAWEVTLPSFSWRMRPDPSFAVLSINKARGALAVSLCPLPREFHTILWYVVAGAASVLAGVAAGLHVARVHSRGAWSNKRL